MLDGAEKKIEELGESHKAELKILNDDFFKIRGDAKTASEAHAKEIADLKAEKASIQQGKDKELSAFSLGFAAYLQNFLVVVPEYNWAPHFLPSTPAYMIKFKKDNAAAIAEANKRLKARIASEKAFMPNKREERGEDTQGNGEETVHASPSNTILP